MRPKQAKFYPPRLRSFGLRRSSVTADEDRHRVRLFSFHTGRLSQLIANPHRFLCSPCSYRLETWPTTDGLHQPLLILFWSQEITPHGRCEDLAPLQRGCTAGASFVFPHALVEEALTRNSAFWTSCFLTQRSSSIFHSFTSRLLPSLRRSNSPLFCSHHHRRQDTYALIHFILHCN
jgi:hypothetical protein